MGRRKARQLAFQVLYETDVAGSNFEDVVRRISKEQDLDDETLDFVNCLVTGTIAHLPQIDEKLSQSSHGWPLSRMSKIDKSLLRVAVYELLFLKTPHQIVINEAVELAKKFGSSDSARFVNGVLGGILRKSSHGSANHETERLD